MYDEAAFLRAIQANPADATAKLVYADWLDERGEAEKAEYLRLSVRLESGSKGADSERWRLYELKSRHSVWAELTQPGVPVWDELTTYCLGRLHGLLTGYAAVNCHSSDIGYDFHAVLRPPMPTFAESVESQYPECAPINLEPLANWEADLSQVLETWLFHELRDLSDAARSRLAVFDTRGRQWMIEGLLAHIRAVINPTAGWRVRVTPKGWYAIDWADVALEASDRILFLHFSFSD
jgi:uncharacterized protein (TIGR02996 family)